MPLLLDDDRRERLWLAARAKESRAPSPAQRKGGGQAAEHGASTGAQGGSNVVGGKRKATAERAVENERAEKRRREVQWAHVRAAMCGVLGRVGRKRRGKRPGKERRASHTPGTATAVPHEVQKAAVAVTKKEGNGV